MEFKIDTKDAFTTIMPIEKEISANLTDELRTQVAQIRQSGSKNFIIDFQHCAGIDETGVEQLISMHEESYSNEQSLVFTGINDGVMAVIKAEEADLLLNIARKMEEAIDIVSMEILERDLLGEE